MSADEGVVSVSEVRRLGDRVRELECLLRHKIMEADILKEALERSRAKEIDLAQCLDSQGCYPMRRIAKALGVSRSQLHARLQEDAKPRRLYHKAQDAAPLPLIRRFGGYAAHIRLSSR